jgi:hypothetical protein
VRRGIAVLLVALCASATTGGPADAAPRAKAYAGTVRLTVADLQDYWANELPEIYGVEYRRIPAARIIPYTSTSKVPRCGPGKVRYRDVQSNAFYCNAGKFVAYDDENLFPRLEENFGDFTIALTLAHEWGHVVQDQAGLSGPTIALEQQADCFAGAWVRHVADGATTRLSLREGNLDAGLAGFLTFRDPPGSDPSAAPTSTRIRPPSPTSPSPTQGTRSVGETSRTVRSSRRRPTTSTPTGPASCPTTCRSSTSRRSTRRRRCPCATARS